MKRISTNIYRRQHRNGTCSWMIRWKDARNGKWRAITAGRSQDEALILEGQLRQKIAVGQDPLAVLTPEQAYMSVNEVLDEFCAHSRFLSASEKWRSEALLKIDKDLRPTLGKKTFVTLSEDQILKFYLGLKARGVCNGTIDKYHGLLCVIGDTFASIHKPQENPLRSLTNYRKRFPKETPTRDINFLTPEELQRLFKFTDKSKSNLLDSFSRFQANSGMRREEAFSLKWTDIDRAAGFIHIRKSKNGKSRMVPLEEAAWNAVSNLNKSVPFVFTRPSGNRPHIDSFLRPLQRAAVKAGISRRIDNHTLRHSFGSNKIRAGWGLKKVSMILGHSDISITAKIYTHLLDGDLKVQDQVRMSFDNVRSTSDIDAMKASDNILVEFLASTLTQSLSGTIAGREALAALSRKVSELSSDIQIGSPTTAEDPSFATLMLRMGLYPSPATCALNDKGPTITCESDILDSEKMEPMSGLEPLTYALRKRCSTN